TALPVDLTLDLGARRWLLAFHGVPDQVALLPDVADDQGPDGAPVVGLTPAGRVEGGAVESQLVLPDVDHSGLEPPKVGVVQVEQLGHRATLGRKLALERAAESGREPDIAHPARKGLGGRL